MKYHEHRKLYLWFKFGPTFGWWSIKHWQEQIYWFLSVLLYYISTIYNGIICNKLRFFCFPQFSILRWKNPKLIQNVLLQNDNANIQSEYCTVLYYCTWKLNGNWQLISTSNTKDKIIMKRLNVVWSFHKMKSVYSWMFMKCMA